MDNRQYADTLQAMEKDVHGAVRDCICDPVDVEAQETARVEQKARSRAVIQKALSKMEAKLGYTVTPHNEA